MNDEDWLSGEYKWEQDNDENDDSGYEKVDETKKRGHLRVAPEPRRAAGKRGNGIVRMNISSPSQT